MTPHEDGTALPPEVEPETRLASARFWIAALGAVMAFGLGAAAAEGLRLPETADPTEDAQPAAQAETPFQTLALQNAQAYPVTSPPLRPLRYDVRSAPEETAGADPEEDGFGRTAGPVDPDGFSQEADPTPAVVFVGPGQTVDRGGAPSASGSGGPGYGPGSAADGGSGGAPQWGAPPA